MVYAYIQGISDVIIRQSVFHTLKRNTNFDRGYIYAIGLKKLRLWESEFYNNKIPAMYFEYDSPHFKDTYLFTLDANFTRQNNTLESGALQFLRKAESKEIIDTTFYSKLHHEETPYAASE